MNDKNGWMRVETGALPSMSVGSSKVVLWVPISDTITPGRTDGQLAICDGELLRWAADYNCWRVIDKIPELSLQQIGERP